MCWIAENDHEVFNISYESVKDIADQFVVINGNHFNFEHDVPGYLFPPYIFDSRYEGNKHEMLAPYPHHEKGCYGMQRNVALNYLKNNFMGDWVLMLDADEFVDKPENIKPFVELLEKENARLCSPTMRHLVGTLGKEDIVYPAGQDAHYVPNRLFKISADMSYPENYHPVLSMEPKEGAEKMAQGSPFTIWHLGYCKEMITLRKRYLLQLEKSTSHSQTFLDWWYHSHLFGGFPTKDVSYTELPKFFKEYMKINEDYLYFNKRMQPELKHWEDATTWVRFFQPKTALEVGCGVGHRTRALLNLGVDSIGFDISGWATLNTPYKELIGRIWEDDLLNNTELKGVTKDLVVAYDVLEHIDEKDLDTAVGNLRTWSNKWILVSVPMIGDPNLTNDSTHKIFWTREQWTAKFESHGLAIVPTPDYFHFKHQLFVLEKKQ